MTLLRSRGVWISIGTAAVGGLVVGAVAGLLAAIAQRLAKGVRNAYRERIGEPPYRDGLMTPWYTPCAMIGMVASAVAAIWLDVALAIAVGSLPIPGLLLAGFLLGAAYWMLQRQRTPPPG